MTLAIRAAAWATVWGITALHTAQLVGLAAPWHFGTVAAALAVVAVIDSETRARAPKGRP